MMHILLSCLAAVYSSFSTIIESNVLTRVAHSSSYIASINPQLPEIEQLLRSQTPAISEPVISKVLATLTCAATYHTERNNILTVIDYSQPSNEKRFWVFNLKEKKLLFHTYVGHGIKSGALLTNNFSNVNNSKASSIGVYSTNNAYYGREGLSLRLTGLDKRFNDNAQMRAIVMHGGWYMDEQFIKKYGRPGRSWGCPALPPELYKPIINTIKEKSLMVVYYPDEQWFGQSKFLNCMALNDKDYAKTHIKTQPMVTEPEYRDDVLFANIKNKMRTNEDAILAMASYNYERIFHAPIPLERMLRRQINRIEYIALSVTELDKLVAQNNREGLNAIHFVIPVLVKAHGTYETQMNIVPLGTVRTVQAQAMPPLDARMQQYTFNFADRANINVTSTNRFIRWLGL